MDNIQTLKNKAFLDDLFYLLAGFDTQSSFLIGETPSLNSSVYPLEMFQPFEFLIFKIREFYKIEEFEQYIQEYLRRLMNLRNTVNTIEELYVGLQPSIDIFKELEKINSSVLRNTVEFPFSMTKNLLSSPILKRFQQNETLKILGSINRWINQADPTNLIEVRSLDEFTSSHWKDLFKIKQISLSKDQLEGIEDCGKIVYLIRKLFDTEIINDDYDNSDDVLRPFCYNGDITSRRSQLVKILSDLTAKQILNELKMIEEIAFLQSGAFFKDFFHSFENELFSSEKITEKLNLFYNNKIDNNNRIDGVISTMNKNRFIVFEECESSLGEYIMRLLRFQKMPVNNKYLINLQKIGISFEDSLISYFIPKKTLIEVQILFRFLFSISSSIYFLQNSKWYNFTRVIYLIFMKIKENSINISSKFFNQKFIQNQYNSNFVEDSLMSGFRIDCFADEFTPMISSLLNTYHITNSEIFPIWMKLIDLSLEYLQIEYKDCIVESHFNTQLRDIVNEMLFKVTKNYGENDFTDFLKNLDTEKYL